MTKQKIDFLLQMYEEKVRRGENLSFAGRDLATQTSYIIEWEGRVLRRYMRMKARRIRKNNV